MAEIATRDGYGKALLKIGEKNKDVVVLDAGVSDSTKTKEFGEKFPDRFFNMGISEQDMIGTAAGLAKSGKIPFATSFAEFLMGRTQDHQLVSVAYSGANVKIVATHTGLAVGEDGPTAQCQNDVGMARAMPTMKVIEPADAVETEKAVEHLAAHEGPAYLRLGRPAVRTLYDDSYRFELGKASVLKDGKDASVIASGTMVHEALKASEILEKEGISAGVVNMSTIKPIDEQAIRKAAETGIIMAAQDHNVFGGLGSAVAEVIAKESLGAKFGIAGINDQFAESDSGENLYRKYGLDAESIAERIREMIKDR